jgi:hypothetical protein
MRIYLLSFLAAQFSAWCRNYGSHETKKRGFYNWNQDFIWQKRQELEMPFAAVAGIDEEELNESDVARQFEEMQTSFQKEFDSLKRRATC